MKLSPPPLSVSQLTVQLTTWYLKFRRDLPWRRTKDPYCIWLSEVMLQQTQVQTVLPYYERFLAQFPDVASLAQTTLSDVLVLWSGLGYYSRARNLHRGAQYIINQLGGQFPSEVSKLLNVPGIGPYTAGAISSIAFGKKAPIVDGNVKRVFARIYAIRSNIDSGKNQSRVWELARKWVGKSSQPGDLNQALMELGATVCKRQPRCHVCPVNSACKAFQLDISHKLPRKIKKSSKDLYWAPILYTVKESVYLEINPKARWWKDLWDLPREELPSANTIPSQLKGVHFTRLSTQKHVVTTHHITATPYQVMLTRKRRLTPHGRWFLKSEIPTLPLSSFVRKVLLSTEL